METLEEECHVLLEKKGNRSVRQYEIFIQHCLEGPGYVVVTAYGKRGRRKAGWRFIGDHGSPMNYGLALEVFHKIQEAKLKSGYYFLSRP